MANFDTKKFRKAQNFYFLGYAMARHYQTEPKNACSLLAFGAKIPYTNRNFKGSRHI